MNKLPLVVLVLLALSGPVSANFLLEGYGASLSAAGSTPSQIGGGGALGFTISDGLSVIYRGMYTLSSRRSPRFEERKYRHMMQMAGLEYAVSIPVVRLGWRASLMAGYSETRIDVVNYETNFLESLVTSSAVPLPDWVYTYHFLCHARRLRDRGLSIAAWTGLELRLIPWVAPFADIGIHKSWYDRDLNGRAIIGYHCIFGVRFRFAGPS